MSLQLIDKRDSQIQVHDLRGRGRAAHRQDTGDINHCRGSARKADDRAQTAGQQKLREEHHGGDDGDVGSKTTHETAGNRIARGR